MAQEHSLDVLKTGFSSYGGLIGIIVSTLLFIKLTSVPARQILIVSLMPVPLVYGVGKIGCFIAGCCKGIAINGLPIRKTGELFGSLYTVIFSPEDLQLIKNAPSERRKFMDMDSIIASFLCLKNMIMCRQIIFVMIYLMKILRILKNMKV